MASRDSILTPTAGETPPTVIGGSEYLTIDKATLVAGHWFNPRSPDEAVVNAQAAREMGVHVGSVIQVPFYTDEESTSSTYNGPPVRVAEDHHRR